MRLGLGKSGMLLAAIFLLSSNSCEPFTLRNATKNKHIPGLPNLNSYVVYSFDLEAKNPFAIKYIELTHNNWTHTFLKYDVINKNSQSGFGVQDSIMQLKEGKYKISFSVKDTSFFETQNDSVNVGFLFKGKEIVSKKIRVSKSNINIAK